MSNLCFYSAESLHRRQTLRHDMQKKFQRSMVYGHIIIAYSHRDTDWVRYYGGKTLTNRILFF